MLVSRGFYHYNRQGSEIECPHLDFSADIKLVCAAKTVHNFHGIAHIVAFIVYAQICNAVGGEHELHGVALNGLHAAVKSSVHAVNGTRYSVAQNWKFTFASFHETCLYCVGQEQQ